MSAIESALSRPLVPQARPSASIKPNEINAEQTVGFTRDSVIPSVSVNLSLVSFSEDGVLPADETDPTYSKQGAYDQAANARPFPPGAQDSEDPEAESVIAQNPSTQTSDGRSGNLAIDSIDQAVVQELQALKQRDAEVRAHERAHAVVGGSLAGQPQYDYVKGPDGRQYAVSGSVNIDVSAVPGDPEATAAKMQKVQDAALAPAVPSGQDRAVAAEAATKERQAEAEILQSRLSGNESEEISGAKSTESNPVDLEAILLGGGSDANVQSNATQGEPAEPTSLFTSANPVAQSQQVSENSSDQGDRATLDSAEDSAAQTVDAGANESQAGDTTTDETDGSIAAVNQLYSSVSQRNSALQLFEATQSLYENLEALGGVQSSTAGSLNSVSSLVDTLV